MRPRLFALLKSLTIALIPQGEEKRQLSRPLAPGMAPPSLQGSIDGVSACCAFPRHARTTSSVLAMLMLGLSGLANAVTPPANSQLGWMLADADSGHIEAARGEDLLLKPASTQKLITTLAAALQLGPDWRYRTHLKTRGQIQDGTLKGDLLIDFVGDPSLTREQLGALLAQLSRQGVRRIEGDVLLNQQQFSGYDLGNGWSWNDLSVCYSAPVAALILDRNCVQGALYAQAGQPARATVPAHQPVEVSAQVQVLDTAERKRTFCALEVEMSPPNQYRLTGCTGPRKDPWPLRFAIQDVDDWGRQLTRWALTQAGIVIGGKITASRQDTTGWRSLAHHDSPPLRELTGRILLHSDNLYTDSLLRTLGRVYFDQPGSFRNGTQAVREILQQQADIDLGPSWLADGSGLSAHNLLRARDLLAVLLFMARDERANWLMDKLPIAGESGTLLYRRSLLNPPLRGKVQAKSGTIAHVQNLAGFIDTKDGRRKAFVLLQNNLSISPEQEQQIARGQGEWPARRFERQLLEAVVNGQAIVKAD
ncbi:D-alanyl-D-alanine carboxypeptidase/D-alanyl-D-alanine endopeptidase [Zobellella maritima]|uniref:D-alanyl-D-alanine carboxypeptidase/D-alanyl-D-alanine endopeptidase n=1 Tax=Zobellella maritima TaxID=2059725 RepID=UPI001E65A5CC|nr:D-alanyl-D-alanine carboxypeptidase/D-alanyl-D-alanine-endopeptidase [Zobellella maritima]